MVIIPTVIAILDLLLLTSDWLFLHQLELGLPSLNVSWLCALLDPESWLTSETDLKLFSSYRKLDIDPCNLSSPTKANGEENESKTF